MRYLNKLLILLAVSLVGCNTTYKANTKSELAKLCLAEFPLDNVPIETKTDTITVTKTEWLEVDCDSIGKKVVPHVCEVKTVVKTITVPDSRQTYIIQNLEGKLELKRERISQLMSLHSESLGNKDNQHKEEIKSLKTKYSNEIDATRKGRNKWRLIAIIGGIAVLVLKRFRII